MVAATSKGLWINEESQSMWKKVDGRLNEQAIYQVVGDQHIIWAASTHEIFRINLKDYSQEKIWSAGSLVQDTSSTSNSSLGLFVRADA